MTRERALAQQESLVRALTEEHPMLRDIPMCILPPFSKRDVEKWGEMDRAEEGGGSRDNP